MRATKFYIIFLGIMLSGCFGSSNTQSDCTDIVIAEMNWASAQLIANIDHIILNNGYKCDSQLIAADTNSTFAAMNSKGKPDIAPEMWINSMRKPLAEAVKNGKLYIANQAPITNLGEGWWIDPKTAKNHPEIKTVLDVLKRPDLFPHKENNAKGAFHTCPAGWACEIVNTNLFQGFNMADKGWQLVNPGSSAGLDGSIAKAVARGEPWFGYYWVPNAIVGKYNLVALDFGVPYVGDEHWNSCLTKSDCLNPQASAWIKPAVKTVVSSRFFNNISPEVEQYLTNRVIPADIVNDMLIYINDNQANGNDAAIEFFHRYPVLWKSWVSSSVAKNIESAIK